MFHRHLYRLVCFHSKSCPQDFVALNDLVEGALQCRHIQGAVQAHDQGRHVKGGRVAVIQLIQKPEALLCCGEGQR